MLTLKMGFSIALHFMFLLGSGFAHEMNEIGLPVQDVFLSNFTPFLIAFAVAVCLVILLITCNICFRRKPQFTGFSNEDAFPDIQFPVPPAVDFAMYPPSDSTPESPAIKFEPLPDVALQVKQRKYFQTNQVHVRPKISHVVRDRLDTDSDIGDGPTVALRRSTSMQFDVKLEKLLTSIKPTFSRDQIQFVRQYGKGWFGKVVLAEGQNLLPGHKKTQAIVQILKDDTDLLDQYAFLQETSPYREIEHRNVLKMLGQCIDSSPYLTVLEYCVNGDLKTYLRSQRSNSDLIDKQSILLNFACDMIAGLQAMHQNNFIHRDFAVRNCLVTSDLVVKVGDYGMTEEVYKDDYFVDYAGNCIPIRWLAPEVVKYSNGYVTLRNITKDSNLWSFGIALWELVTFGGLPYCELSNEQVLQMVIYEQSVKLLQPEVPVSNLFKIYQLMELCWLEPSQRPSLRELRIMLLHLQSSKDELDGVSFDQKWNQLMPRHAASLELQSDSVDYDLAAQDKTFNLYNQKSTNSTIPMIATRDFDDLRLSSDFYHRSFDSDFSELNASLLAQAGSLQPSLMSLSRLDSPLEDNVPEHLRSSLAFPVNELSLETELQMRLTDFPKPDGVREGFYVEEEQDDGVFLGMNGFETIQTNSQMDQTNFQMDLSNFQMDQPNFPDDDDFGRVVVGDEFVDKRLVTNGDGDGPDLLVDHSNSEKCDQSLPFSNKMVADKETVANNVAVISPDSEAFVMNNNEGKIVASIFTENSELAQKH